MIASDVFDVLVVGAGPTGLACAIEAQRHRLKTAVIDKGCLVNSLFHYPAGMVFFTTPELLEIGDMPFSSAHQKPTREEALEYYRRVAQHFGLDVRQYQRVIRVEGQDGDFRITALDQHERRLTYHARKLVLATGYYDLPNIMGIPGEELAKVTHYYREPHP
ncbi:MAG TPA: NAD(P)-binding domain-containing protein, partial [Terriglobales bacterium]|nr:NAD(P)-binding domain-containing protein [Terriglobales bacterium]